VPVPGLPRHTFGCPATPSTLELRVFPEESIRARSYRVSLSMLDGDGCTVGSLGQLGGLSPDADGFVDVYVSSTLLVAGRYQLIITAEGDTHARSTSLLKVVPATANEGYESTPRFTLKALSLSGDAAESAFS
jgi:hypothetical protein